MSLQPQIVGYPWLRVTNYLQHNRDSTVLRGATTTNTLTFDPRPVYKFTCAPIPQAVTPLGFMPHSNQTEIFADETSKLKCLLLVKLHCNCFSWKETCSCCSVQTPHYHVWHTDKWVEKHGNVEHERSSNVPSLSGNHFPTCFITANGELRYFSWMPRSCAISVFLFTHTLGSRWWKEGVSLPTLETVDRHVYIWLNWLHCC